VARLRDTLGSSRGGIDYHFIGELAPGPELEAALSRDRVDELLVADSGLDEEALMSMVDAAQRRARAARERLTSDFDWQTVAQQTTQVYLAAKRRERQPLARLPIVEHALPDR